MSARHSAAPLRCSSWSDVFALFPCTPTELAAKLTLTRQGLHNLRKLVHAKPPHWLLERMAKVLRKGTADGSPAPTQQRLTQLWNAAKEAQP